MCVEPRAFLFLALPKKLAKCCQLQIARGIVCKGGVSDVKSMTLYLRVEKWRATLRLTMILSVTVVATLAAVCPIFAQPSESTRITSGRQIAITICGNCHEDPASSRNSAVGPRLEDIANLPSTTALSLKEFLGSRHKKRMPNFLLSRADTDDVIAYILSLKRK